VSPALQKRRGEEDDLDLPACWSSPAAARGKMRCHCSSTVAVIPEVFLCNSWSFGGLFCKFELFNVIFI